MAKTDCDRHCMGASHAWHSPTQAHHIQWHAAADEVMLQKRQRQLCCVHNKPSEGVELHFTCCSFIRLRTSLRRWFRARQWSLMATEPISQSLSHPYRHAFCSQGPNQPPLNRHSLAARVAAQADDGPRCGLSFILFLCSSKRLRRILRRWLMGRQSLARCSLACETV